MRRLFVLLSVLAGFIASPALADLRATYRIGTGEAASTVTIEASDTGAYRIAMPLDGSGFGPVPLMFGTAAGELLFVMPLPERAIVVRVDDLMAISDELMGQTIPADLKVPPAVAEAQLSEAGTATVNGRSGRRFLLKPQAEARATPQQFEIVVSDDPALAPLVRVMASGLTRTEDSPLFQQLAPPFFRHLLALVRASALLRFGEFMELTKVEFEPIPAEHFQVPGSPVSREELRALMASAVSRPPAAAPRPAQ